jgi:hypothetical protein
MEFRRRDQKIYKILKSALKSRMGWKHIIFTYKKGEKIMAQIGERFKTGQTCLTSGVYIFDDYTDGTNHPSPTQEERVIPLCKNETFPPIRSCYKAAWWKLQRIT